MKDSNTIKILILLARPAAGKSELIQYLRSTAPDERVLRFHIGEFEEIDDFPMLWTWFEEDKILSELGQPRLHTTQNGYFKHVYLWDLLIRRIGLEYKKRIEQNRRYHEEYTTIIEFSRGSEHGGYRRAFLHLDREMLKRSAVLYIKVSYKESVRKNQIRYNPDRPYSIMEHSLPDDKMESLYRESDWETFSAPDLNYLNVQGEKVPYAVLENEDDATTRQDETLGIRLEEVLGRLWEIYKE
jgi:hypothetical protein